MPCVSGQGQSAEWVLESRRLRFRQMTAADEDVLFSIFSNPLAMRYFPAPWTRAEVKAAIERNRQRYEKHGYGLWLLVRKDNDDVIGDCGLVKQHLPGGDEVEVGYHLHPDHWGFGFATEAASRCLTFAFESLRLARAISLIRPENGPSRRVAERNGLTVSGEIQWHDLRHLTYAIDRQDWLTRRTSTGATR